MDKLGNQSSPFEMFSVALSNILCTTTNLDLSCVHVLVFPWDQRELLFLGVPNLLMGTFYRVKNGGCLLEVFIMRLFNQTLSIYDTLLS